MPRPCSCNANIHSKSGLKNKQNYKNASKMESFISNRMFCSIVLPWLNYVKSSFSFNFFKEMSQKKVVRWVKEWIKLASIYQTTLSDRDPKTLNLTFSPGSISPPHPGNGKISHSLGQNDGHICSGFAWGHGAKLIGVIQSNVNCYAASPKCSRPSWLI